MLEQSILKSLEERSKVFKFVFYDQETGESMSSNEIDILEEVLRRNKEGENFALVTRKYLVEKGLQPSRGELGDIATLLNTLQDKRILKVNYEEMNALVEFLWCHDSDFKITNINEEDDSCMFHLL